MKLPSMERLIAVLLPQLKVVLMEKCVQVPPNVASQLVSAYPEACVSGKHREFFETRISTGVCTHGPFCQKKLSS